MKRNTKPLCDLNIAVFLGTQEAIWFAIDGLEESDNCVSGDNEYNWYYSVMASISTYRSTGAWGLSARQPVLPLSPRLRSRPINRVCLYEPAPLINLRFWSDKFALNFGRTPSILKFKDMFACHVLDP